MRRQRFYFIDILRYCAVEGWKTHRLDIKIHCGMIECIQFMLLSNFCYFIYLCHYIVNGENVFVQLVKYL